MLIGYARVSKADGSQSVDLQLDELLPPVLAESRFMSIMHPAKKMIGRGWNPA